MMRLCSAQSYPIPLPYVACIYGRSHLVWGTCSVRVSAETHRPSPHGEVPRLPHWPPHHL